MRTKKINPTIDQLSANERAVLNFLKGYPTPRFRGPTLRQISAGSGVALTTTYEVVLRLEGYGFLERKGRRRIVSLKGRG